MKVHFKKSITFKIFAVTSILLLVATALVYATIYFILPGYYTNYKKQEINGNITELVKKLNNYDSISLRDALLSYTKNYNILFYIADENDSFVTKYDDINRVLLFSNQKSVFSTVYNTNGLNTNEVTTSLTISTSDSESKFNYQLAKPIKIKDDPSTYYLHAYASLQPVSEVSLVMFRLIPFILIAIFIISLAGAIVYARLIAKPLLNLNRAAREMAKMNLDARCNPLGSDELGELGHSLNTMAASLQNSMDSLKESNRKLELDIEKEREFERQRRDFMASVSHELKTPLTIIKGQLEGMIRGIGVYKDREKYLRRSYSVTEEMEGLVKEVLDISKMEASNFKLDIQRISLSDTVFLCLAKHRDITVRRNLKITEDIGEGIMINADRKLIIKALLNVINNAVNHSPEGEAVMVKLTQKDGLAYLEVENSGAHINEEDLPRIFEAFYTVDKSRSKNAGSNGLGLYIVKRILDMHSASYKIANTVSGVRFSAELAACGK